MPARRQVYVISDLHIGGAYPESTTLGDRGFRICTHARELAAFIDALAEKPAASSPVELVINGDFIDFLAERRASPPVWSPFLSEPAAAVEKLHEIVARDRPMFDALARLLARGHALVIALGNHDIELAIPQVRRALEDLFRADGRRFRFIYDGEAYVIGDTLIEHGNRYDNFNVVDHDRLRRFRSLLSRRQPIPPEHDFEAPPGSRMVAEVINPIKERYRFIDLLKPEVEAMIPLLLALEPGLRAKLARVLPIAADAARHRMREAALPALGGDISAGGRGEDVGGGDMGGLEAARPVAAPSAESERLRASLEKVLGPDASSFLAAVETGPAEDRVGGDISSGMDTLTMAAGLLSLLVSRSGDLQKRLPALVRAVRAVQNDRTFDRDFEPPNPFSRAAEQLAREGKFRHVVFGHTHLARVLPLPEGARYYNTGTWADLMRFPKEILTGSDTEIRDALGDFCADMAQGRFEPYIAFAPTYLRLDVDENDRVTSAELRDYASAGAV